MARDSDGVWQWPLGYRLGDIPPGQVKPVIISADIMTLFTDLGDEISASPTVGVMTAAIAAITPADIGFTAPILDRASPGDIGATTPGVIHALATDTQAALAINADGATDTGRVLISASGLGQAALFSIELDAAGASVQPDARVRLFRGGTGLQDVAVIRNDGAWEFLGGITAGGDISGHQLALSGAGSDPIVDINGDGSTATDRVLQRLTGFGQTAGVYRQVMKAVGSSVRPDWVIDLFDSGLKEALRATWNGSTLNRTGSYGTASDRRLKSNFSAVPVEAHWAKGLEIAYREFERVGVEGRMLGVIADELAAVYPSLIEQVESHGHDEIEGPIDVVKYSILMLIGHSPMMQEAQRRIEALEQRIAALEGAT